MSVHVSTARGSGADFWCMTTNQNGINGDAECATDCFYGRCKPGRPEGLQASRETERERVKP